MANGTIAFDTLQTSDSKGSSTEKSVDTSYIYNGCLLYTSPSPRDGLLSRMPSSA